MKQLYFLDEEEKNRILNLHESATKRHYLGEQATTTTDTKYITDNPNDKAYDYKMENGKYYFKGKPNTKSKIAQKYTNWTEATKPDAVTAIANLFKVRPNGTQTQVKQDANPDPSKAATVTANSSLTTPTTPATGAAATTTSAPATTTTSAPATNTGSGVISVNANDIVATPETETQSVAGTQVEKPAAEFKSQTLPDFKGYTAPKPA